MVRLSYTAINNLHNGHEWINKQMKIPVPKYPFLTEGKEAHRIIQDHVSGKKKDKRLKHIEVRFPIVEEKDFDPACKFSFNLTGGYQVTGFIDGLDPENGKFLEIKTANTPWSMKKFQDAMQRKLYALAKLNYKEAYLITGSKNPDDWKEKPLKVYSTKLTQKDRTDAQAWIAEGVAILEKGDFTGGLDKDGKCEGCFWNIPWYSDLANCNFL
jgi:hypothetical protein